MPVAANSPLITEPRAFCSMTEMVVGAADSDVLKALVPAPRLTAPYTFAVLEKVTVLDALIVVPLMAPADKAPPSKFNGEAEVPLNKP